MVEVKEVSSPGKKNKQKVVVLKKVCNPKEVEQLVKKIKSCDIQDVPLKDLVRLIEILNEIEKFRIATIELEAMRRDIDDHISKLHPIILMNLSTIVGRKYYRRNIH